MGFFDRVKSAFGGAADGTSDEQRLRQHAHDDRKALEEAADKVLAGQFCDGCGRHCKLTAPRCMRGQQVRAKRLARAGIRE